MILIKLTSIFVDDHDEVDLFLEVMNIIIYLFIL
jgi:hypothetical protein